MGFEPMIQLFTLYFDLADRRFKPLSHSFHALFIKKEKENN